MATYYKESDNHFVSVSELKLGDIVFDKGGMK